MAVAPSQSNDPIQLARDIAPVLRSEAEQGERDRRLTDVAADALRQTGMFRLFRPLSLGGWDLDPVHALQVVEVLAAADASAAWNVSQAITVDAIAAWLPAEGAEQVLGDPDAVTCGAWHPHRTAERVEGGYRLTGRTQFNSNCMHATAVTTLAHVVGDDGPEAGENGVPMSLLAYMAADDVEIVPNWETLGLGGTGSHDVVAEDVFVPESRTAWLLPLEKPNEHFGKQAALTTWPGIAAQVAVSIGVAQSALDALLGLAEKVPNYTVDALRDRPVVQCRVGGAAGKILAARSTLHQSMREAWRDAEAGVQITDERRAQFQLASCQAASLAAEAVHDVYLCSGTSGIRNEGTFQRYLREASVMTQHAFFGPARFQNVGEVLLGAPCTWGFFAI